MQIKGNLQPDGTYDKKLSISSGVTLILPYGNASDANGRNQSGEATLNLISDNSSTPNINEAQYYVLANTLPERYRQTLVKVCENVTITVYGTLEICGELTGGGGGNMSGHTAGKYASLELMDGAKIESSGIIKCYGFIENSSNANGQVTIDNGGHLYVPFVLVDFKGGTIMSALQDGMSKYGFSPFNQFNFPNVSVKLIVNYGGQMSAWCNLNAGEDGVNHTTGLMVGSTSSAFIQLTDSTHSYLEAKYDPETRITDLKICGGANMNSMSLTVTALGMTKTVKSSDFVFAFSWLFNITLDNNEAKGQESASFSMPHKYKMLPGSTFTVERGATLTVGSFTIYTAESFDDRLGGIYPNTGVYPEIYPSNSTLSGTSLADALLTVRGNLIATNLGGKVYTDVNDATVMVTGKTRVDTYEATVIVRPSITGEVTEYQTIVQTLSLVYAGNEQKAVFPNAIFTSNTVDNVKSWYTDAEISWITITIPADSLPEGAYIIVDPILIVENGVFVGMDVYDSRIDGNKTIFVIPGTSITYYLQDNHLVTQSTGTSIEVTPGDLPKQAYSKSYEAVSGMQIPKVYVIPRIQITGYDKLTDYNVTFKNLGAANCYAEVSLVNNDGIKLSIFAGQDATPFTVKVNGVSQTVQKETQSAILGSYVKKYYITVKVSDMENITLIEVKM